MGNLIPPHSRRGMDQIRRTGTDVYWCISSMSAHVESFGSIPEKGNMKTWFEEPLAMHHDDAIYRNIVGHQLYMPVFVDVEFRSPELNIQPDSIYFDVILHERSAY